MEKTLLKMLSVLTLVTLAVILIPNISASAQEKQTPTIPEVEVITQSNDDEPLITIKRATGEIETIGHNDLFDENSFGARAWNNVTWNIPANGTMFSTVSIAVRPGDHVAYRVSTQQSGRFRAGFRNNVTGQTVFGPTYVTAPGQLVGRAFLVTETATLSFAIHNQGLFANVFSGQFARAS